MSQASCGIHAKLRDCALFYIVPRFVHAINKTRNRLSLTFCSSTCPSVCLPLPRFCFSACLPTSACLYLCLYRLSSSLFVVASLCLHAPSAMRSRQTTAHVTPSFHSDTHMRSSSVFRHPLTDPTIKERSPLSVQQLIHTYPREKTEWFSD